MASEGSAIQVGDAQSSQDAFVIFELYLDDMGEVQGRTQRNEFKNRAPTCKSKFDTSVVECKVSNKGMLSSDLLIFEHQFVFCTSKDHKAADGFSAVHAGEVASDPIDAVVTSAYVSPRSELLVQFPVPKFGYGGLANLYFRCRVSTLWAPVLPMSQWNFATDPQVTEMHLRLAPER